LTKYLLQISDEAPYEVPQHWPTSSLWFV